MGKCPVCGREVRTPFALRVDAWRWLKCGNCGARLERKNPRYMLAVAAFLLVAISLGKLLVARHIWLADALIAAPVVVALVMLMRPQLQVRKAPAEPEVVLRIDRDDHSKR